MADPYRRVQHGEKLTIPAQAWNRLMDSISIPVQTGGELAGLGMGSNTIVVKNISGEDVPRFGVLGVSGPVIDPSASEGHAREFARRPAVTGVKPVLFGDYDERFVVCLEPIKPDRLGVAVCSGVFACKLDVENSGHIFATPKLDSFKLVSSHCGVVQLLWKQSGTGEDRWAIGVM